MPVPNGSHPRPAPSEPDVLGIRFWGVRGSVAVPGPDTVRYGGNTSCVEVRWGREVVIFDAGTGIRELGKTLARDPETKSVARLWILVTHTHWDHIQGFPFFAPAYDPRRKVRILGGRGSRSGLRRTVATAVESPFFPVSLPQMPGTISVDEVSSNRFRIGPLRARTGRINHPGGGVGFRLDTPAGSFAYIPDHEIPFEPPHAGGGSPRPRPGDVESRRRLRVAHRRNDEIRELIRGVDVLVHDAQYSLAEYRSRVGWGHSCVDAVVRQAAETGVRRLILFHHDPDRSDAQIDQVLKEARELARGLDSRLAVDAAREGWAIRLRAQRSRTATAAA